MSTTRSRPAVPVRPLTGPVQVESDGHVSAEGVAYLREKVTAALDHAPARVLYARARLLRHPHEVAEPVIAQVNVDVNGRAVRAQVRGGTEHEAADRLQDRLRHRLSRLDHLREHRGGRPAPAKPAIQGDPVTPSRITRRKVVALERCTVVEAAAELELMDYAFHFFAETGGRGESVVHRLVDGRLQVQRTHPDALRPGTTEDGVHDAPGPVPRLTSDLAVARLDTRIEDFLFYVDEERGGGCVLYRRHDRALGLLVPLR